ncbi:unnamed protein product [Linum tenue]|uniref:Uncharacterized protein n=1 Tax=Linum tenue TaxID=586396 RepID=A0AAV0HRQ5_9ROSI|nr:unnamed protein product [Linum tenue]CAI0388081.1 unnamed protein product [Linum tenue]
MNPFNRFFVFRVNSFSLNLFYFLFLSFAGYWILIYLGTRPGADVPRTIDYVFTAVSTATDSSMSVIEMEAFSNSQLLFMTFLMFVGGEVFVSVVVLTLKAFRVRTKSRMAAEEEEKSRATPTSSPPGDHRHELELSVGKDDRAPSPSSIDDQERILESKSVQFLSFICLCYLIVIHIFGVALLSAYVTLSPSASRVLEDKGIKRLTFALFTAVSTFGSCGFIPTNENMIVFRHNTVMQLILIPQVLMGNTMFPPCLRLCVWLTGKLWKAKSDCTEYLLRKSKRIGFYHLLPGRESAWLTATVVIFLAVQFALFLGTDWWSEGLIGLNTVEKLVGALFLTVNARHSGETIVDLNTISAASLVVFVVMMYLPPYTFFLPMKGGREVAKTNNQGESAGEITRPRIKGGVHHGHNNNKFIENFIVSQLSFLSIFIILICITERQSIVKDPLNYNVFNIIFEVISAYGNVGFSMGYGCKRQINPSGDCQDKYYGFSGKWSDEGKIVLILVMLFGRLKKFNMDGGKAWILL